MARAGMSGFLAVAGGAFGAVEGDDLDREASGAAGAEGLVAVGAAHFEVVVVALQAESALLIAASSPPRERGSTWSGRARHVGAGRARSLPTMHRALRPGVRSARRPQRPIYARSGSLMWASIQRRASSRSDTAAANVAPDGWSGSPTLTVTIPRRGRHCSARSPGRVPRRGTGTIGKRARGGIMNAPRGKGGGPAARRNVPSGKTARESPAVAACVARRASSVAC